MHGRPVFGVIEALFDGRCRFHGNLPELARYAHGDFLGDGVCRRPGPAARAVAERQQSPTLTRDLDSHGHVDDRGDRTGSPDSELGLRNDSSGDYFLPKGSVNGGHS